MSLSVDLLSYKVSLSDSLELLTRLHFGVLYRLTGNAVLFVSFIIGISHISIISKTNVLNLAPFYAARYLGLVLKFTILNGCKFY